MPLTPVAVLNQTKAAKRAQEITHQLDNTEYLEGYQIRPAIGTTGGAKNLGWELNPIQAKGPPWYLATKELAIEAIKRHRSRYA